MHRDPDRSETDFQEIPNYVREEHEMPSFISNDTVVDVEIVGNADPGAPSQPAKEEMVRALQQIYIPILKCLKLFGLYFGDTSLEKLEEVASTQRYRTISFSLLQCIVSVTCLWLNVVMVFVSLCFEGIESAIVLFILLTNLIWGLQTAISATVCLAVLPLTEGKPSHFKKFLQNLMELKIDLGKLKSRSIKSLIAACAVWMMSVTSNVFTLLFVRGIYVGTFQPWKNWYGFTVFNIITIVTFLFGAWLLPVAFICFTCSVVEHLFEEFSKRVLSSDAQAWQLDLAALREEHRRLCGISELASKMLSPLFLVQVAAHIPLTCFCFYISVHPPDLMNSEPYFDEVYYMTGTLYWLLLSAVTVAVILVFGSRVNAKVSSDVAALGRFNVIGFLSKTKKRRTNRKNNLT